MSDEKSRVGKEQRRALREELLRPIKRGDGGVYQLEFSRDWYREIRFGGKDNPWLKITATIAKIKQRQTRKGDGPEPQKYEQISFFDEGE